LRAELNSEVQRIQQMLAMQRREQQVTAVLCTLNLGRKVSGKNDTIRDHFSSEEKIYIAILN
jgi:hypothetical protein